MKKYFYSDGKEENGPFSFEELKDKNITEETLIWFEGLDIWTYAKYIKEFELILEVSPPPLNSPIYEKTQVEPPPLNISNLPENKEKTSDLLGKTEAKKQAQYKPEKKINKALATAIAILACIVLYFIWSALFMILEDMVFGWKPGNNGGTLYVVAKFAIFIFCIRFVWKKIRGLAK